MSNVDGKISQNFITNCPDLLHPASRMIISSQFCFISTPTHFSCFPLYFEANPDTISFHPQIFQYVYLKIWGFLVKKRKKETNITSINIITPKNSQNLNIIKYCSVFKFLLAICLNQDPKSTHVLPLLAYPYASGSDHGSPVARAPCSALLGFQCGCNNLQPQPHTC